MYLAQTLHRCTHGFYVFCGPSHYLLSSQLVYSCQDEVVRERCGRCFGRLVPLLSLIATRSVSEQTWKTTPASSSGQEQQLLVALVSGRSFEAHSMQVPVPSFIDKVVTKSLEAANAEQKRPQGTRSQKAAGSISNHQHNSESPDFRIRKYQRDGIAWLWLLRHLGLHGLLSDDMGLGKTLQVSVG